MHTSRDKHKSSRVRVNDGGGAAASPSVSMNIGAHRVRRAHRILIRCQRTTSSLAPLAHSLCTHASHPFHYLLWYCCVPAAWMTIIHTACSNIRDVTRQRLCICPSTHTTHHHNQPHSLCALRKGHVCKQHRTRICPLRNASSKAAHGAFIASPEALCTEPFK